MKHHAWRMVMMGMLAALSACSQKADDRQDASSEITSDVSPTAAPGVAFTYRYAFGLPDARISAAQEAHATACERLGLAKCRITGMTFDLDERDRVSASLDLALDPMLARGFGKAAIAGVTDAGGSLRRAEITGEDQGPAIAAAAAREAEAERAARSSGASLNESNAVIDRRVLRDDANAARNAVADAREEGDAARARLSATPMHLTYQGGGAGRGFGGENPARDAWYLFIDSAATMVGFVLKGLAVALPWLVLFGLAILAIRSRLGLGLRRWWRGEDEADVVRSPDPAEVEER